MFGRPSTGVDIHVIENQIVYIPKKFQTEQVLTNTKAGVEKKLKPRISEQPFSTCGMQ